MVNSQTFSNRINAHLKAAKAYAELSSARRLKVGAVIVREDRIVSIGYNGTTSGSNNNCEVVVGRTKSIPVELILESKPEVCHAEMNAIMFAAKNGVSTNGCSLIVTHSPCFECAKMIIQCGIKSVHYEKAYRDMSAVEFLKECNIEVMEIKNEIS